jgi:hypothetical protein
MSILVEHRPLNVCWHCSDKIMADTQFAYLCGIRVRISQKYLVSSHQCVCTLQDFVEKKKEYLKAQVGNPEGADKPNKKVIHSVSARQSAYNFPPIPQFYDPRVWVREGEKTLVVRVKEACADLGNVGELMDWFCHFAIFCLLIDEAQTVYKWNRSTRPTVILKQLYLSMFFVSRYLVICYISQTCYNKYQTGAMIYEGKYWFRSQKPQSLVWLADSSSFNLI